MGLSGFASRRHPHVVVMAPALTESGQTQSFTVLPSSALNLLDACDLTPGVKTKPKSKEKDSHIRVFKLAVDETLKGANGTTPKRSIPLRPLDVQPSGGDSSMNCDPPMGDQPENMGLLKSTSTLPDGQENLPFMKPNDVEQLLAEMPGGPNVDEIMRAFSSMDSENAEFPLLRDLASIEKDLLMEADEVFVDEAPDVAASERLKEKEEEVTKTLHFLERLQSRLLRRTKKFELREVAKQAAMEVKDVLEHTYRLARPVAADPIREELSNFVDRLDSSAHNLLASAARFRPGFRYFGSGSVEANVLVEPIPGSILPKLPSQDRDAMLAVSCQLRTQLAFADSQFDSDATDSSSGGDSCDESINYNNNLRSCMSTKKRAYWRWHQDRSAVATRWTWLCSQAYDLDYRIRHYTEQYRKHRQLKGPVVLAEEPTAPTAAAPSVAVNGYHGALPGGLVKSPDTGPNGTVPAAVSTCCRARPYLAHAFRKRDLVQVENLHLRSKSGKVQRAASTRCWCVKPAHCLLCTGREDPTQPASWPALDAPSLQERIAALDPSYHPVLSLPHDVPLALHLDSVMRLNEWQTRANRSYKYNKNKYLKEKHNSAARLKKSKLGDESDEQNRKKHKHATAVLSAKLLKKKLATGQKRRREYEPIPPLRLRKARKVSYLSAGDSEEDDLYVTATPVDSTRTSPEPVTTMAGSSTVTSDRGDDVRRRARGDSFDINNIVIPYSMAASTRVEKLQYKEIPTPKWRLVNGPEEEPAAVTTVAGAVEEEEDTSDQAVMERHARCEEAERRRFMSYIKLPLSVRGRASRRTDSRADSGTNTPDPMSPMNIEHGESPLATPPSTPQGLDELCPSNSNNLAARRRTISNSRSVLRDRLDHDRCPTPDPEDEVAPYEPRTYPLRAEEYERMQAVMPPEVPPSPGYSYRPPTTDPPAVPPAATDVLDGEGTGYHCEALPESPSSSSTISATEEGEDPDDPDDPEWQAADEEEEDTQFRGRR